MRVHANTRGGVPPSPNEILLPGSIGATNLEVDWLFQKLQGPQLPGKKISFGLGEGGTAPLDLHVASLLQLQPHEFSIFFFISHQMSDIFF